SSAISVPPRGHSKYPFHRLPEHKRQWYPYSIVACAQRDSKVKSHKRLCPRPCRRGSSTGCARRGEFAASGAKFRFARRPEWSAVMARRRKRELGVGLLRESR